MKRLPLRVRHRHIHPPNVGKQNLYPCWRGSVRFNDGVQRWREWYLAPHDDVSRNVRVARLPERVPERIDLEQGGSLTVGAVTIKLLNRVWRKGLTSFENQWHTSNVAASAAKYMDLQRLAPRCQVW
jgi:hypothetical protein